MLKAAVKTFLGNHHKREAKRLEPIVDEINELVDEYASLSDDQLKAKTDEFKQRIADATAALQAEIEGLANSDRDRSTHRLLAATYLGPSSKQVAVAAELGMSYATYRRRHGEAVDRLVEILWLRDGHAGSQVGMV